MQVPLMLQCMTEENRIELRNRKFIRRLVNGVERRNAQQNSRSDSLVVRCDSPPITGLNINPGKNADHWSRHAPKSIQQGHSSMCGKENALFPFFHWLLASHISQDEEKMKEKSTITNDYLYVYRFFVSPCMMVTCATPHSNLEAALNILICLNFTIAIIFARGFSASAKLYFYDLVLHPKRKSSDLHINWTRLEIGSIKRWWLCMWMWIIKVEITFFSLRHCQWLSIGKERRISNLFTTEPYNQFLKYQSQLLA